MHLAHSFSRRAGLGLVALALGAVAAPAWSADKTVTIGIQLPFTGADAESAARIKYGALMAIDEVNAAGGVAGYKLKVLLLDSGTATAGQYDPAQAATNARKMVSDKAVVAAIGPEMSGEGKAMAPILSAGDLAIITPSATNPDITDPKFAGQYMPKGRAIFFRTVTTDAFQGPNMANYYKTELKVNKLYILDDSGAYGVGLADSFEAQARKIGIEVLGRDRLDPKAADYSAILTQLASMKPDALYYGGVGQAGVKILKQSYDIMPKVIKGGGDGLYSPDMLVGGGFPAAEGWYATIASPHVMENPEVAAWVKAYVERFKSQPDDYAITAHSAALVVIDAIKRVAESGKPVERSAVRDAIETANVKTLQGDITFDMNGDITNKIISVFQIKKDDKFPLDDMIHQFKYMGVAPASAS